MHTFANTVAASPAKALAKIDYSDRRHHARLPLGCAVKVYDPIGRRYRAGVTKNISAGGALIELHGSLYARAGQELGVAIDWSTTHPLIGHNDLSTAIVVRVDTTNATAPTVAIRFAAAQPHAAAA